MQPVKKQRVLNKRMVMYHFSISLHAEYKDNKEITRERLILETLEQVLPKAKIYIMNDNGETVKYLPLQQLENTSPQAID